MAFLASWAPPLKLCPLLIIHQWCTLHLFLLAFHHFIVLFQCDKLECCVLVHNILLLQLVTWHSQDRHGEFNLIWGVSICRCMYSCLLVFSGLFQVSKQFWDLAQDESCFWTLWRSIVFCFFYLFHIWICLPVSSFSRPNCFHKSSHFLRVKYLAFQTICICVTFYTDPFWHRV